MSKRMTILVAGIGIGVLAIGALSAGSLSPHSATDQPPIESVPRITDASQITLPLDIYVPSSQEVQTLRHGVYAAIDACMAGFGFTYDAPLWYLGESGMFPMENGRISHDLLYGLLDMAQAQRSGYHPNLIPAEEERAQAEQDWQQEYDRLFSHSHAYLNVMGAEFGGGTYAGRTIPEGGCFGEGQRQVQGSDIELVRLFDTLGGQSWQAASEDGRVQAVFEKWSVCMSKAGFNYDTPWTANNEAGGPDVTDAEIAIAVADVRCKQQTNVVGVYAAVDGAYQRVLIDKYAVELGDAKTAFDSAVDKAETLIAAE